MTLKVGVFGAAGRMGRAIVEVVAEHDDLAVAERVDVDTPPEVAFEQSDVVIDFSVATATCDLLARLERAPRPLVTGTTGRDARQLGSLDAYSRRAPVFVAPNFSFGVAVLTRLAELAHAWVGDDWDLGVFETHHRHKLDAPSGTAKALLRAVGCADGLAAALRGGDVVGEHTVFLFGAGERLELTHRATDRKVFARGAVRAARWLVEHEAGRYYGMSDLLLVQQVTV